VKSLVVLEFMYLHLHLQWGLIIAAGIRILEHSDFICLVKIFKPGRKLNLGQLNVADKTVL